MNTAKGGRPNSYVQDPAPSIESSQVNKISLQETLVFSAIPISINSARDELLDDFIWTRGKVIAEKLRHKNVNNILRGDEAWMIMTLIWKETHFPSTIFSDGLTAYRLGVYISANKREAKASVTRAQNIVHACQAFDLIDIEKRGNKNIIFSTHLLDNLINIFAVKCKAIVSDL